MNTIDHSLSALQQAVFEKYAGGAPGVLASGVVWLAAGLVALNSGIKPAFVALFFGGMLIHPAGVLIARLIVPRTAKQDTGPLDRLAMESTVMLFAGLLIAYMLLGRLPELALPSAALAVGARYFVFRSIYGDDLYWILGGAIAAAATLGALAHIPATVFPLIVGAVEIIIAAAMFARWSRART